VRLVHNPVAPTKQSTADQLNEQANTEAELQQMAAGRRIVHHKRKYVHVAKAVTMCLLTTLTARIFVISVKNRLKTASTPWGCLAVNVLMTQQSVKAMLLLALSKKSF
jgi:hypothetical protein